MIKFVKNMADVFEDYRRQIDIHIKPNKSKPEAEFTRYSDGSLEHNVDLSDFDPERRKVADKLVNEAIANVEKAGEELQEARASGDEELIESKRRKLAEAQETFTEVKWELETREVDLGTANALIQFGPVGLLASEALRSGKLDDRLEDAAEDLGTSIGEVSKEVSGGGSGEDAAADGTSEASEGDDPTSAYARIFDDIDGAIERFETDPKAFFDELKKMTPDERNEVMMMIQNQIQANNRLMSMLTNFQQAQHDTNKAVIANLRV